MNEKIIYKYFIFVLLLLLSNLAMTFLTSSRLLSATPASPYLISSIAKTPSPFLSSYRKSFPRSKISFSDSCEAMKVNAIFFSLLCYVKFFNALKFNGSYLFLDLMSSFIHG